MYEQLTCANYVLQRHSKQVYRQTNMHRLSVIDPNNSENDIAGGSKNTPTILDSFSNAHKDLVRRMSDLNYSELDERQHQSILGAILGGDYSSFIEQRAHLARLHEHLNGTAP